jgi:hypothetical protein
MKLGVEFLHKVTYPDGTPGTERVTYLGTWRIDTPRLVRVLQHRTGNVVPVYRRNLERLQPDTRVRCLGTGTP